MKTINLINLDKSEVKYEMSVFPDGEPHIKIFDIDRKETYKVICRIASSDDLFRLMQVGDILNRQEVPFELVITYLMSMRMDRVVQFDEAFTLKLVANVINEMHPTKVYIFEAHSDKTFKLINNSESYDADVNTGNLTAKSVICYPDHGAADRYAYTSAFKIFNKIGLNKKRDLNDKGKIVSLEVEIEDIPNPEDIMIIDDLCDAGGTFCWAAKILREKYSGSLKHLAISVKHLVNPVGLKNLAENFDDVYITNSYKDWDTTEYPNVHVIKII